MEGGGGGSTIQSTDHNGQTPLHLSLMLQNRNAARQLFYAGADIETRDHRGETPIEGAWICHHAARGTERPTSMYRIPGAQEDDGYGGSDEIIERLQRESKFTSLFF